jgi:hypothetical protein
MITSVFPTTLLAQCSIFPTDNLELEMHDKMTLFNHLKTDLWLFVTTSDDVEHVDKGPPFA